jgi:hypothetical protein
VKLDPAPAESSTSAVVDSAKHRCITYRVRNIPDNYDEDSLCDALCASLQLEQRTGVKIHSLATDVSRPGRRIATVSFHSEPLEFSSHNPSKGHEESTEWKLELFHPTLTHNDSVCVDTHFKSFTPLSPFDKDEEHVIE